MNDDRLLQDTTAPHDAITGYTLEAHTWYSGAVLADYAANTYSTLIGTYTDNGDGTYTRDIVTTVKGVIIAKNASGTAFYKKPVPANTFLKLEGDNQASIVPGT